jgi:hypothetical protein
MLYDSNGFKPYIFFDFLNFSMYHTHTHTHIYIFYWPYAKIHWIWSFREVFEVFGAPEAVFTGHVWPLARTCPGIRLLAII